MNSMELNIDEMLEDSSLKVNSNELASQGMCKLIYVNITIN